MENSLSVIDKDGTFLQRRAVRQAAFVEIEKHFNRAYGLAEKNHPDLQEESSLSDEEIKSINENILGRLKCVEGDVKSSLENFISENETDILKKTALDGGEFSEILHKNIGKAFSSFEETEQKRKTPTKPETLKRNLQKKVFTAVEQTYNNIPKEFNHKHRLTDNLDRAIKGAARNRKKKNSI